MKLLTSVSQMDLIHSIGISFINVPLSFNSVDDGRFAEVFKLTPAT